MRASSFDDTHPVPVCASLVPDVRGTGARGHSLAVHIEPIVWEGRGLKWGSYRVVCWMGLSGEPRAPGNKQWKTCISRKAQEACLSPSTPTPSPPGGPTAPVPMGGLHSQAVAYAGLKERPFSKHTLTDSIAW